MILRTPVAVALALVFVLALLMAPVAYSEEPERFNIPIPQGSPALGPPDAAVTIVEFIDYQ